MAVTVHIRPVEVEVVCRFYIADTCVRTSDLHVQ